MGDLQLKGYSREKGISDNRKSRRIALAERVCVAQVRSWEKAESVQHRGREGLGGEALSKTQVWWDSCLLSHDLTELKPHSVPPHEMSIPAQPTHCGPPATPTSHGHRLPSRPLQPPALTPTSGCTSEHVSQALPVKALHWLTQHLESNQKP